MILTNEQTAQRVEEGGLITNYVPHKVTERDGKAIYSFGQAGAAYDYRLGREVQIIWYAMDGLMTPQAQRQLSLPALVQEDEDGRAFVLLPHESYALATVIESWKIPLDMVVISYGKSSYTRLGLIYSITPFDPGWEGTPTITIHNPTAADVRLYIGEGIATAVHHALEQRAAPYFGKYQLQPATVTFPL